jgi:hypothetical protein
MEQAMGVNVDGLDAPAPDRDRQALPGFLRMGGASQSATAEGDARCACAFQKASACRHCGFLPCFFCRARSVVDRTAFAASSCERVKPYQIVRAGFPAAGNFAESFLESDAIRRLDMQSFTTAAMV